MVKHKFSFYIPIAQKLGIIIIIGLSMKDEQKVTILHSALR